MDFAKILPLAIVMIAGPQILSSIFLATSENWRRNSAAYVIGAACSLPLFVTLGFVLGIGASNQGASSDTIDIVVLVLLVAAGIHTFLTRKTAEPPKWMGKLQTASPSFSFKLGFLLLGIFPTDILTSFAVGSYLSNHGDSWTQAIPFLLLTLLFVALPGILVLALGARGQTLLPKVRDWMHDNSWVVSEAVIGLFILLVLNDIV